ncbi:Bug1p Ecym_5620 [Eremothecium cymbalariae DBVPG|uniref:Uncharacterized protein n=1 Tax=Eremothecium cymbalariae (strain CBS 270.75 / DBVPG 7215 / KCTC 17166 / NRRL Y-17582) TaxID=931890 RepID=I6NE64_ERECY|nr:hypothetical protein Ecym_5620 [Eremothecium cymbalariae DBVPG\
MSNEDREQKIEDARRRVEELKKKKKEKKEKKKKQEEKDTVEGLPETDTTITNTSDAGPQTVESAHSSVTSAVVTPQNKEVMSDKEVAETDDLFGEQETEHDFMTTIRQSKEDTVVKGYDKQISELQKQIKQLKFINMDQESTIEELNDQIKELSTELATTKAELSATKEKLISTQSELQKASSNAVSSLSAVNVMQHPEPVTPVQFARFASASPVDAPRHTSISPIDRNMIIKWKNWNIDMSEWRSLGGGPVVEF